MYSRETVIEPIKPYHYHRAYTTMLLQALLYCSTCNCSCYRSPSCRNSYVTSKPGRSRWRMRRRPHHALHAASPPASRQRRADAVPAGYDLLRTGMLNSAVELSAIVSTLFVLLGLHLIVVDCVYTLLTVSDSQLHAVVTCVRCFMWKSKLQHVSAKLNFFGINVISQ